MKITKDGTTVEIKLGKFEDWLNVCGQKFTDQEAKEACDFSDLMKSYNVDDKLLSSFVKENMKTGYRLYMAANLPVDQLGVLILNEEDSRIVKVAQSRCGKDNRENEGRGLIILPGEIF